MSNGTITIVATGGTGELMFEWSNGAITSYIDNLAAGEYFVTITDASGCNLTQSVIVLGGVTAIDNIDVVVELNIYPVPATTFLNLNAKLKTIQIVRMEIYDVRESLIWTKSYLSADIKERINTTSFAKGIYTLVIHSSDSIQSKKFVVIK